MQTADAPNTAPTNETGTSMGVDDVLYIVFRHKWLILAAIFLGAAGACMVRVMRPPLYVSQAKINVPYIKESGPTATGNETYHATDAGAQSIINTEGEILRSLNVASNTAVKVGPQL